MNRLIRFVSSRKLGVVLLAVMVALLLGSTYFPNQFTITTPEGWEQLKADKPFIYELSKYMATDVLVNSWPFAGLSAFLFLSTLFGLIQGLVFALLSTVYIVMMLPHDDHHGDHTGDAHGAHGAPAHSSH